ncbi:hypothetical protein PYK79_41290 [Streptomyces sp. ID05-04B]|uniref:hypothetical protein n=1 Tax=Streptomyces sp. ID05-04B TaxID=3028661 RepID=UPI0029C3EF7D|nr:hypothetical protein [Streptomyces sp. ID05-04B]MDX5568439.1 hypothetical protein [Streptomyces sp. ID05-04B]
MSTPFSFADFEATFSPEDCERHDRLVAAAPPFSQEQREALKALFAPTCIRPANPAADAA